MELAVGIIMVCFAVFWVLAYLISLFANEPEKQGSSQPLTIADDTPTDDSLASRLAKMAAKPHKKRTEIEQMCLEMAATKYEAFFAEMVFDSLSLEEKLGVVSDFLNSNLKDMADYQGDDPRVKAQMMMTEHQLRELQQEIQEAIRLSSP